MKQQLIPVQNSFREWQKNPAYAAVYNSLEQEFSLASALIQARSQAGLTQQHAYSSCVL